MRILAITNLYPRPGHERIAPFNRQQFRALAESHVVRVLAPVPWHQALRDHWRRRPTPDHYTNADGIEVNHPIYYYPPGLLRSQYGRFYLRSIRGAVRIAVREFRPDVLLSCWTHPDGWAAARLAREYRLPVVLKAIGSDVLVITREARRRRRIAEALRQSTAVVTVCGDLADHAVKLGAAPHRVQVVSEGL
ncbi:MAG TPA: glycosyltransferase, partial [Pirellulales bacterium]